MERHKSIVALSLAIVFSCCTPKLASCAEEPGRPNIIIITLDALRADHLGCYGYKRNTSANIDRLAKEGVMFTQAIAQAPQTAGSIPSLMSSMYSSTNGIFKFKEEPNVLTVPILPALLKDRGYVTAAISGHGEIFASIPGMERGFDFIYDEHDKQGGEITAQALSWLERNKNKAFFLWVHFFDTHAPYHPPAPYNQTFLSHELRLSDFAALQDKFKTTGVYADRTPKNMTEQEKDYLISQYDGEIKFADKQVGVMLDYLKRENLLKNTLIILTADHGENLYDNDNIFGHGEFLYEVLLKVPLIIKCENIIPKEKVIDWQVQLIDVMPTIIDMAKLSTDIKMEGRSLLPLVLGKEENYSLYAFSETANEESARYSIRSAQWKLVYNFYRDEKGKYELYNLKTDPKESINLVESEKERFQALKAELEKWMNRPRPDIRPAKASLDEETRKNLKSLGYLQ